MDENGEIGNVSKAGLAVPSSMDTSSLRFSSKVPEVEARTPHITSNKHTTIPAAETRTPHLVSIVTQLVAPVYLWSG